MNTGKPTKTPLDYMVIAVSPALIMILVHSLCFFLVDIFYQGAAGGGVRWVLFWFVLAAVLIARIGIEQGSAYAMGYGLFLALAVLFNLAVVQHSLVFGAILLGVVWFTAHKLTLNCTLIDEDEDASGQGLMQSLKQPPDPFHKPPPAKKVKAAVSQTPGVWLIYYSLAALPIFGLGQVLLPAGDLDARHRGLVYLFLYLAAALGLLVTTSFLGLRRYLRQRYLAMPGNIALGWIKFGAVAAVVVLCVCLFLPRPGAGAAWGSLRYKVDDQLRRASDYAARFNPHGTGSGRAGNESSAKGQQENKSTQPGQQSAPNQDKGAGTGDQGDKQSGTKKNSDGTTGQADGEKSGQPSAGVPPPANSIYPWVKALFWLAVIAGLVWFLLRYRAPILAALSSAWAAIRQFIAMLLGHFRPATPAPSVTKQPARMPPFSEFKNPFLTGGDKIWPPEKLIVYSYNALQSRALEQAAGPGSPQTPREFCRQLGLEMPEAAGELEHLAFLYGHVAYGVSVPASYNPEQLRLLWSKLPDPRRAA